MCVIYTNYLASIVGTPFQYCIKNSNLDLFQLGFGEVVAVESDNTQTLEINKYAIHFDSAIYLYWKNGMVDRFYSDSHAQVFNEALSCLIGKKVNRIKLSSKNDLWIEFEDCKMVIVTRDDEDESWRFLLPRTNYPHLIASSISLVLDDE